MGTSRLGTILMVLGAIVVIVGFLLSRGWLGWFGRLPGDIRVVTDSTRVYIPITSMLLISLAITLILNLVRRL